MKITLTDWKTLSIYQLCEKYNLSAEELYQSAVDQQLYKYSSPKERRRMSSPEKIFIKNNQNLTVSEVANILHKSYNATLIQIKMLGYYDMIG